MSDKVTESIVEQTMSDILYHVDALERPVSAPEKMVLTTRRK